MVKKIVFKKLFYQPNNFFLAFLLVFIVNCGSAPKQIEPIKAVAPLEQTAPETVIAEILPNEPAENTIYFAFNEFLVAEEYFSLLSLHVNYLKKVNNAQLTLEGNTDSLGSKEANYKLGLKRALAVLNYLTKQGIAPARINHQSFGEENLLYPEENNQAEQAKNRRVEIYYTYN